uniref:Uncharacterized protein n=1 Tax=Aegilops tauschii subsp. strangulata TaxID=200361 RepID=A0A453HF95_AEGTS
MSFISFFVTSVTKGVACMFGPKNTRKRRILNVGRGSATCEDKEGQPVLFLLTSDATSHEKAVSFFFFFQVCSSSKFVSSLKYSVYRVI